MKKGSSRVKTRKDSLEQEWEINKPPTVSTKKWKDDTSIIGSNELLSSIKRFSSAKGIQFFEAIPLFDNFQISRPFTKC